MSRRQRVWSILLGGVLGTAGVFVVLDHIFEIRERFAARAGAYARASGDPAHERRREQAVRYRIAVLLRPRDTNAGIGGAPSSRLIEAGLLYGRLALLQEAQGRMRESRSSMAQGVALLRRAGHPEPTEAHIRQAVASQDAARASRK